MELIFSDGMKFNTDGEFRVEVRSDGPYVVGKGMLVAVKNWEAGQELIRNLTSNKNDKHETKNV